MPTTGRYQNLLYTSLTAVIRIRDIVIRSGKLDDAL